MNTFVFIILHYQSMQDTENCIMSIKKLDNQDYIRIIVADNASPNGTGKVLFEKYKNDTQIHIELLKENYGFSKGNNIAFQKARNMWDADYYIVANSDIVFVNKDFVKLIEKKGKDTKFAIAGPDIYCPSYSVHQSPMGIESISKQEIKNIILRYQWVIKYYDLIYPLIKIYFLIVPPHNQEEKAITKACMNWEKEAENVLLFGACLIFSKTYIQKRGILFFPETKFYHEENILTYWCKQNNMKILYDPELQVEHRCGSSTNYSYKESKKRLRFQIENGLESAKKYLDFIETMKSE